VFVYFSVLLTFALLSFGAVLPHSWTALFIAWVAGFAGLILIRAIRGSSVDLRFLVLVVILMALSPVLGLRYAVGLSAAIWAWHASTTNSAILRLFRFLLVLGVAEALLGLYQHFAAPGWIFGYQNVGSPVSGTLINRNHFAGLLEMLIPISFGLAYAASGRENDPGKAYVFVLAGACMAVALAFSLSRMGLISFVTTMVLMGILIRLRNRDKKFGTALGLALFGLFLSELCGSGLTRSSKGLKRTRATSLLKKRVPAFSETRCA